MFWRKNKKVIVTHSGKFHPDEVFATACLSILFEGNIKVIRTRDEAIIKTADFVLDLGREYNPAENKFDHHQGGVGEHKNGVPYATFGLVWKHFGPQLAGSQAVADRIESKLVLAIDSEDNAFPVCDFINPAVKHFTVADYIYHFGPTWLENDEAFDLGFNSALGFAIQVLKREIKRAKDILLAEERIVQIYNQTSDKRIIVLDKNYHSTSVLSNYPEPLFVIRQAIGEDSWHVNTVKVKDQDFVARLDLPLAWANKEQAELATVTGVVDAVFCHAKRFMCVARSREGAIRLAELALKQ